MSAVPPACRHTARAPARAAWGPPRGSPAHRPARDSHVVAVAKPLLGDVDAVLSTRIPDADILGVDNIRTQLVPRPSPFVKTHNRGGGFIGEKDLVTLHTLKFESPKSAGFRDRDSGNDVSLPAWAVRAGPRETIYFDPEHVTAAIVTCGGLCPGLNDVIQSIVCTLHDYGVPSEQILGIRNGLKGFYSSEKKPITLSREFVEGIHLKGGTILGTSRGGAHMDMIVHRIKLWKLNMVFVIGGNGGNAAANAINAECVRQQVACSVVGVPKSIDNDILLIDRCFGFETAVSEAQRALRAAKVEARSALRGLGVVKVMGRSSGFIAMMASMASGIVDVCLIPEVPFSLTRLQEHVESILTRKGHCVVCLAEGAGQDLLREESVKKDASGNPILGNIGTYLSSSLKTHFKEAGRPVDLKYIDPTYMVRAIPTIPSDHVYCKVLGQNAVHAAFAGFTGITSGLLNTHYVLLPIPTVIAEPRQVNVSGRKWNRLMTAIEQPSFV